MSQMVPWLVFCLLFLVLALAWPKAARIVVGVFFIVMAVAVNWVLSIVAPELFVALGTDSALLPLYRWGFENVVAGAPALVGVTAGLGEIAVGALILSKGTAVRVGLGAGIVFLLVITPLGVWTLPNPVLAAALAVLLRQEHDQTLPELVRARVLRPARAAP